jgi:hypothetical protein
MAGKGFNVAEQGHIVNMVPPVDITGAEVIGKYFSMAKWAHASIIIQAGVTGAASTVTVECSATSAGGTLTALPFSYYAEATDAGDTLTTRTTVANTGFATSTNNNIMYVIEIDASALTDAKPWVTCHFSNPGGSTIASAVAILSGSRYTGDPSVEALTAIA